MEIITERLYLREVVQDDYDFLAELETDELCLQYESDMVPTKDWIDKKFNETLEDTQKVPRDRYRLIISEATSMEPVGRVVLWKIDDSIQEWEIGWYVHPKYWGKGYAPEAARALLGFAFNELKVHRIQALCHDQNINSEKVMVKIGMKKEGTCRGVRLLNNQWHGSHIYSILEDEFDISSK